MPPLEVVEYFAAERAGGWLLCVLALAAMLLGVWLWSVHHVYLAMAWPLALIALLEFGIGLGVALRAPGQVADLAWGIARDRATTVAAERMRMQRVNRNFRVATRVEGAVIVLGAGLVVAATPPAWSAIGMGLVLQAAALLVFDVFAAERAERYSTWLDTIVPAAGRARSGLRHTG